MLEYHLEKKNECSYIKKKKNLKKEAKQEANFKCWDGYLQSFEDGLSVHGLFVVGGLVEGR